MCIGTKQTSFSKLPFKSWGMIVKGFFNYILPKTLTTPKKHCIWFPGCPKAEQFITFCCITVHSLSPKKPRKSVKFMTSSDITNSGKIDGGKVSMMNRLVLNSWWQICIRKSGRTGRQPLLSRWIEILNHFQEEKRRQLIQNTERWN